MPRVALIIDPASSACLRAAALALSFFLTACGDNSPAAETVDAPFDFYVLSLSWSPSYCAAEGDGADPQQCDSDRDLGYVVHGLWPQFEEGWPEFCDDDTRNPSPDQTDAIADLIPSNGLIRHQWRKHGTCSGLGIDDYFDTTRAAFERITLPEARPRVSAASVLSAFREANEGLPDDGLAVSCGDGMLREVRICLTRDLEFRSCPEVAERSCRQRDLRMPAP